MLAKALRRIAHMTNSVLYNLAPWSRKKINCKFRQNQLPIAILNSLHIFDSFRFNTASLGHHFFSPWTSSHFTQ